MTDSFHHDFNSPSSSSSAPLPPPGSGFHQMTSGGMPGYSGSKPNNHLAFAIVTMLFCCLPFGVVAVVNAARVDKLWHSGNPTAAVAASVQAKTWAIASLTSVPALMAVIFLLSLVS